MIRHRLTFITPLFSRGSYDHLPEIRPASIRGQLHWWFRALGGSAADENAIFGSVHSKPVLASKIVVRVGEIQGQTGEMNTLPHKNGTQASPKACFKPGASFGLIITERLGGLDERLRKAFYCTLETWLLIGTLGLRSTRAGGSFAWTPESAGAFTQPPTVDAYRTRITELLKGAPLKVVLLADKFSGAEDARRIISDTLGGRDDRAGENDLTRLNHPLGKIFQPRKTSPLRFRIVQIGTCFHIVAMWDDRNTVTGNRQGDLQGVIDLLATRGKQIGKLLQGQI